MKRVRSNYQILIISPIYSTKLKMPLRRVCSLTCFDLKLLNLSERPLKLGFVTSFWDTLYVQILDISNQ